MDYLQTNRRRLVAGLAALGISGSGSFAHANQAAKLSSLPSLPLPTGARISAIGDSVIRRGSGLTSPISLAAFSRGELEWVRFLDQRFEYSNWHDPSDANGADFSGGNQGIDGEHLVATGLVPGVLSRLPALLQRPVDIVIVNAGTNDISTGDDGMGKGANADTLIERLDRSIAEIVRAKKWAVLATLRPRDATSWSPGNRKHEIRKVVNTWITSQSSREGVKIWNPNPSITIYASQFGEEEWKAGYTTDGVHPSPMGAFFGAQSLVTLIETMVAPGSSFDKSIVGSNAMPNGRFAGRSGTKGSGVSGEVADGWSADLTGGSSTAVATKETDEGTSLQSFEVSPRNDFARDRWDTLSLRASPIVLAETPVEPGDWFQVAVRVDLSAWGGWVAAGLVVSQRLGSTIVWSNECMRYDQRNVEQLPVNVRMSGWIHSSPICLVRAPKVDRLTITLQVAVLRKGVSGTGTVKFSNAILRKVDDPTTRWGI